MVSNLYDLNIVNKTFNKIPVNLKLEGLEGELKLVGNDLVIEPQGNIDAKFLILLPKNELTKMSTPINLGVYSGEKLIERVTTSFLAPMKKKLNEDEKD